MRVYYEDNSSYRKNKKELRLNNIRFEILIEFQVWGAYPELPGT